MKPILVFGYGGRNSGIRRYAANSTDLTASASLAPRGAVSGYSLRKTLAPASGLASRNSDDFATARAKSTHVLRWVLSVLAMVLRYWPPISGTSFGRGSMRIG